VADARITPGRVRASTEWPPPVLAAAFLALCLIWGLAFVVFHVGLAEVPPLTFSASRAVLSGVVFAGLLLTVGERPPRGRHFHQTAILLGLTNISAFWGLQNLALARISPGVAAILTYVQPLVVALGAWLFLGERMSPPKVGGLLLGFAGVVAVMSGQIGSAGGATIGYVLAAGAGLAWGTATVIFKRVGTRHSVVWLTAFQSVYGAVPLVILAALLERPRVRLDFTVAWTLTYASLGAAVLAYLLWLSLLRQRDASSVAAFVFLVPVIAVVGDTVFLGDRFGPSALLGGALVVLGIWLVNHPDGKRG
jgi:drug/metabolite transporter (DMT)-like permease